MKMDHKGIKFLKEQEGFRSVAYDDAHPNVLLKPKDHIAGTLTIGYGHTGPDVYIGQKITEEEAEELLIKDLEIYENAVNRLVKVPLTQNQFNAIVSLVYNIGTGAFAKSTMLKRLNSKDYKGAAEALTWWNKTTINGRKVISDGLVARRNRERTYFLGEGYTEEYSGEILEDQPARRENVTDSKTIKGTVVGILGAVGAFSADLFKAIGGSMNEWVFSALMVVVVLSFLYIIFTRIDDWIKGYK